MKWNAMHEQSCNEINLKKCSLITHLQIHTYFIIFNTSMMFAVRLNIRLKEVGLIFSVPVFFVLCIVLSVIYSVFDCYYHLQNTKISLKHAKHLFLFFILKLAFHSYSLTIFNQFYTVTQRKWALQYYCSQMKWRSTNNFRQNENENNIPSFMRYTFTPFPQMVVP